MFFDRTEFSPAFCAVSFRRLLDDFDFVLGQAVKIIDEAVNLRVRGGDLAFERSFFLRRARDGQSFVQFQHLFNELHHPVVRGFVGLGIPIWKGKLASLLDDNFWEIVSPSNTVEIHEIPRQESAVDNSKKKQQIRSRSDFWICDEALD